MYVNTYTRDIAYTLILSVTNIVRDYYCPWLNFRAQQTALWAKLIGVNVAHYTLPVDLIQWSQTGAANSDLNDFHSHEKSWQGVCKTICGLLNLGYYVEFLKLSSSWCRNLKSVSHLVVFDWMYDHNASRIIIFSVYSSIRCLKIFSFFFNDK